MATNNYEALINNLKKVANENIDVLFRKLNIMKQKKAVFNKQRAILNEQLRPGISQNISGTGIVEERSGSILGSIADTAIAKLNFLGNASDCSWLNLSFNAKKLNGLTGDAQEEIQHWIEDIQYELQHLFSNVKSKFYCNARANWADWFIEGASAMKVEENEDGIKKITFVNVGMDNIYIYSDSDGEILAVANEIQLTRLEAKDKGLLTSEDEKEYNNSLDDQYKTFIDFVILRDLFFKVDEALEASYIRLYIDKEKRKVISARTETSFPYIISRQMAGLKTPYGQSVLWSSIKSFEYFNNLAKNEKALINFNVNPIYLTSKAELNTGKKITLTPGDIVYGLDSNTLRPTMQPMSPSGDLGAVHSVYQSKYLEVERQLYAEDVLPPNANAMTATEILRRELQHNKRILPLIENRKQDFLAPLIYRCMEIMYADNSVRSGGMPKLSQLTLKQLKCKNEIEVLDYMEIQFGGQLKNLLQAQSLLDLENFVSFTANIGLSDFVKGREVIEAVAEYLSIETKFIKTEQEVAEEQQARAEAEQQQREEEQRQQMRQAGVGNEFIEQDYGDEVLV